MGLNSIFKTGDLKLVWTS